MNYLGIDYGEVNYGFAIGNSITKNSTTYFSEKTEIFACDVSSKAIERAKHYYGNIINFFAWDITKDFESKFLKKFDLVICNEVLYYIDPKKYPQVVNNIFSLLNNNGYLILSLGHYFDITDVKVSFKKLNIDFHKEIKRSNGNYYLIVGGKLYE